MKFRRNPVDRIGQYYCNYPPATLTSSMQYAPWYCSNNRTTNATTAQKIIEIFSEFCTFI